MKDHIRTQEDALARFKMRVAAARAKFAEEVENIFKKAKERKIGEIKQKIADI